MPTFFRKNFKISNITAKLLFALMFVLSHWQTGLAATLLISATPNWLLAIAALAFLGVCFMLLLPLITGVLLSWARIVSVPRAEFNFFAYCFCTVGFVVLALLNSVNLFTPLALVWGGAIFPLVATLSAAVAFYATTSKLYFNDLTRPHYFKMCAIYFVAFVVLFEVL